MSFIFGRERGSRPDAGAGEWSQTTSQEEKRLRRRRLATNDIITAFAIIEESRLGETFCTQKLLCDRKGKLGRAIHLYSNQRAAKKAGRRCKSPVLLQVCFAAGRELLVSGKSKDVHLGFTELMRQGVDTIHHIRISKKDKTVKHHTWGVYNYDQILHALSLRPSCPYSGAPLVNRICVLNKSSVTDAEGVTRLQCGSDGQGDAQGWADQILCAVESYREKLPPQNGEPQSDDDGM